MNNDGFGQFVTFGTSIRIDAAGGLRRRFTRSLSREFDASPPEAPRPVRNCRESPTGILDSGRGVARRSRGTGRQPTCEHADFSDAGRRAQRWFRVDFPPRDPWRASAALSVYAVIDRR
jgi:hypothetical protein